MDTTEKVIAVVTTLVLLYFVVFAVRLAIVESECLSYGYPKGRVDMVFSGYCVKRVDQTDVVVPVSKVRP